MSLSELINCLCGQYDDVIVMGDLNARVGKEQTICPEVGVDSSRFFLQRASGDSVVNSKGTQLIELLDEYQLFILNGRCIGDTDGAFTYIGASGSSVIDLCCGTPGAIKDIEKFEIGCEIYSDHMPLCVSFLLEQPHSEKWLPLLPRLPWKVNHRASYQVHLENLVLDMDSRLDSIDDESAALVKEIHGAASSAAMVSSQKLTSKQPWWDWECIRAIERSFALLGLHRKSNSEMVRLDYVKANTYFKNLCKTKSAAFYRGLADRFAGTINTINNN
ncbi:hypothetical protein GE061_000092 [Apolygus lucorum]|uniref:Endonuclease/exonuclease/phosphatase domain-containing protein n=1 Tax=Apolygus lucorum TaxID=248454 RepID=A0A8S9Y4U1_APOLU|nr:hypothetical protein GE061_000092 [Apolygus lucorum]